MPCSKGRDGARLVIGWRNSSGMLCLAERVALGCALLQGLQQFRSCSTHPTLPVLMSCLCVCYCSLVIPVGCQSSLQPVLLSQFRYVLLGFISLLSIVMFTFFFSSFMFSMEVSFLWGFFSSFLTILRMVE